MLPLQTVTAAGIGLDARVFDPIYADLGQVACLDRDGDAAARCRVRLGEMTESIRLIRTLLRIMPDGPVSTALPTTSGEGLGCAESGRGARHARHARRAVHLAACRT